MRVEEKETHKLLCTMALSHSFQLSEEHSEYDDLQDKCQLILPTWQVKDQTGPRTVEVKFGT